MPDLLRVVRATPKHLSRTGKLNSFTYLMLNLPFICNYRCTKCFNLTQNNPHGEKNLITINERIGLIEEAKRLGAKAVVIAGEGEPSIHPEFDKLIEKISSDGMTPIFYSNGSCIDSKRIKFLKKHGVVIIFSFDTLDEEKYDKLSGTKGNLKKVVANIQNAIKEYAELTVEEKGMKVYNLAVNTTVSHLNENEVEKIKSFFGKGIYFVCNPIVRLGNAEGNWGEFEPSDDSILRQKKLIQKLSDTGGPLTLGADGFCGYSRWGIGISPSGEYMTCAYTTATNKFLGNIRTKTLKEAFEFKHKIEGRHYAKFGVAPCLVRMTSFAKYVEELKK